jgi:hypothetical protein
VSHDAIELKNSASTGNSYITSSLAVAAGQSVVDVRVSLESKKLKDADSCVFAVSSDGGVTYHTVATATNVDDEVEATLANLDVSAGLGLKLRLTLNGSDKKASCILVEVEAACPSNADDDSDDDNDDDRDDDDDATTTTTTTTTTKAPCTFEQTLGPFKKSSDLTPWTLTQSPSGTLTIDSNTLKLMNGAAGSSYATTMKLKLQLVGTKKKAECRLKEVEVVCEGKSGVWAAEAGVDVAALLLADEASSASAAVSVEEAPAGGLEAWVYGLIGAGVALVAVAAVVGGVLVHRSTNAANPAEAAGAGAGDASVTEIELMETAAEAGNKHQQRYDEAALVASESGSEYSSDDESSEQQQQHQEQQQPLFATACLINDLMGLVDDFAGGNDDSNNGNSNNRNNGDNSDNEELAHRLDML